MNGKISGSFAFLCALTLLASAGSGACGSAAHPPPEAPEPAPLEPSPTAAPPTATPGAEAPSSHKVEEAMDAIKRQDFAVAKSLLSEARKENPKDPQAAFYLGVALQGLSDIPAAAGAYTQALKLDPKLTDASVNLSAILIETKDPAGALTVIDAGLASAPKQPDLLLNRALALEASGKKDEALTAYGEAVAATPTNTELRIAYAELLTAAKQDAKALEQLRAVASTDDVRLLAALAHKFGKLKAFPDCIQALDRAIKAKNTADFHVRRAVCRHGQGDQAGALSDYYAAIKLDDKFAPAHYYLGMHVCNGNKRNAAVQFKKVLELSPNDDVGKRAKLALDRLKTGKCGE